MRNILLAAAVLFASALHAQDKDFHTIYYKNGKKAIEGRWTYTDEAYFSGNSLIMGFMSRPDVDDEPRRRRRQFRVSHESSMLALVCDGLIRMWYSTGQLKTEVSFSSGIANGPYKSYYHNGNLAEEGKLTNGQPDSEWKVYSQNGELEFTGHYKIHPQDSLDKLWKELFRGYDRSLGADNKDDFAHEERDAGYETAISAIEAPFYYFDASTENESTRHGLFTFPDTKGGAAAILNYKDNLRDGVWDFFNRPGHRALSITYASGKILSVKDSTGKQRGIDKVIAKWKEDEKHRIYAEVTAGPTLAATTVEMQAPQPFRYVEQKPSFKGSLIDYLDKNMRHPKGDTATSGKVYVEFIVLSDGRITNERIVKSLAPAFDAEALRLVRTMPKWSPGKNNGQAVSCYFTLPISFSRD